MKRARVGGDEQDAFSGWRHVVFWQRGELRKLKRRAGKRERRTAKTVIGQERSGERLGDPPALPKAGGSSSAHLRTPAAFKTAGHL